MRHSGTIWDTPPCHHVRRHPATMPSCEDLRRHPAMPSCEDTEAQRHRDTETQRQRHHAIMWGDTPPRTRLWTLDRVRLHFQISQTFKDSRFSQTFLLLRFYLYKIESNFGKCLPFGRSISEALKQRIQFISRPKRAAAVGRDKAIVPVLIFWNQFLTKFRGI